MSITELLAASPPLLLLAAFIPGLCIGSFLNVVIRRYPKMLEADWREQCQTFLELPAAAADSAGRARFNLATPGSHCPQCRQPITALDNIPVLSWLLLRGRCRHCHTAISLRYPLVELVTALLTALVVWHFGLAWPTLALLVFTWSLITLTMIDADTQLLPDDLTLPLLWLGLLVNVFGGLTDLHSAVLGAMGGYLLLWGVYWSFRLLAGKEGMGYGDFKLLAALGAWLGWQALPQIILLASVVGALAGLGLMLLRGHGRDVPIPFGPYLAAAGFLSLPWVSPPGQLLSLFTG